MPALTENKRIPHRVAAPWDGPGEEIERPLDDEDIAAGIARNWSLKLRLLRGQQVTIGAHQIRLECSDEPSAWGTRIDLYLVFSSAPMLLKNSLYAAKKTPLPILDHPMHVREFWYSALYLHVCAHYIPEILQPRPEALPVTKDVTEPLFA